MDSWRLIMRQVIAVVLMIALVAPGTLALQCYNCQARTDFDDTGCLEPNEDRTLIQECQGNEVCEKKLIRMDAWTEIVVRGCSSNCDGRTYIWTEDFRVHCCGDDNLCNAGTTSQPPLYSMLVWSSQPRLYSMLAVSLISIIIVWLL